MNQIQGPQQTEISSRLERKPREGEIELYKALLSDPDGERWFHLYELQKKFDNVCQTTAHRWLSILFRYGLADKEREHVGNKPRDKYRLNSKGKDFAKKRIERFELEVGTGLKF